MNISIVTSLAKSQLRKHLLWLCTTITREFTTTYLLTRMIRSQLLRWLILDPTDSCLVTGIFSILLEWGLLWALDSTPTHPTLVIRLSHLSRGVNKPPHLVMQPTGQTYWRQQVTILNLRS